MNVARDKYREEPIVNRQLASCSRSEIWELACSGGIFEILLTIKNKYYKRRRSNRKASREYRIRPRTNRILCKKPSRSRTRPQNLASFQNGG